MLNGHTEFHIHHSYSPIPSATSLYRGGDTANVTSINLLGAWNVLLSAQAEGISHVLYFSAGKSSGMLEREPGYLLTRCARHSRNARASI